jgi:aldose 1-epimerase
VLVDSNVTEILCLRHEDARCDVLAHVGGSLGAWTVGGQEMLRSVAASGLTARDPYATAGFPLVPYSNRIGAAQFEWQGELIRLARNFSPEPHAIHGVGFERRWQVLTRTDDSVLLSYRHRPDTSWPWAFEAQQHIALTEDMLSLDLSAVNLAAHAVPLAFGHHPYFPRRGAHLTFHAHGVWLAGADALPTQMVKPAGPLDFSHGAAVEDTEVDHCYSGWNGVARIVWPEQPRALAISASRDLGSAVVYSRRGLDAFCFEPVAHVSNALNRPNDASSMPTVAAGESFTASIRLRAIRP